MAQGPVLLRQQSTYTHTDIHSYAHIFTRKRDSSSSNLFTDTCSRTRTHTHAYTLCTFNPPARPPPFHPQGQAIRRRIGQGGYVLAHCSLASTTPLLRHDFFLSSLFSLYLPFRSQYHKDAIEPRSPNFLVKTPKMAYKISNRKKKSFHQRNLRYVSFDVNVLRFHPTRY